MAHPQQFEYLGHLISPTQDGFVVQSPEGQIWQCLSLQEARKQIHFDVMHKPEPVGAD